MTGTDIKNYTITSDGNFKARQSTDGWSMNADSKGSVVFNRINNDNAQTLTLGGGVAQLDMSFGALNVNRQSDLHAGRLNHYEFYRNDDERMLRETFNSQPASAALLSGGLDARGKSVSTNTNIGIGTQLTGAEFAFESTSGFGMTERGFRANVYAGASLGKGVLGVGVQGVRGLSGRTTDYARSVAFGASFDVTGPSLIFDVNYIRNGRMWTLNIGEFFSNLAYGNVFGAARALIDSFQSKPVPTPPQEVILPDDRPDYNSRLPMFEKGTTEFTANGQANLQKMIANAQEIIKQDPNAKIEIGQYVDSGWFYQSKREALSVERQEKIKDALIKQGIPAENIVIGHQKVDSNDNAVTVQDHNTNIRVKSATILRFNSGAEFDPRMVSPKGLQERDKLMASPEFQEVVQGKSKMEQELAANMIFGQTVLGKATVQESLAKLRQAYSNGVTIMDALTGPSRDEYHEKLRPYIQPLKEVLPMDAKEETAFMDYLLTESRRKGEHYSEDEAVAQYVKMRGHGITMLNYHDQLKTMMSEMDKIPAFKEVLDKSVPDERPLLAMQMMTAFINSDEKDMKTFLHNQSENMKQSYQPNTMSRNFLRANIEQNGMGGVTNNDYQLKVENDTATALKERQGDLDKLTDSAGLKLYASEHNIPIGEARTRLLREINQGAFMAQVRDGISAKDAVDASVKAYSEKFGVSLGSNTFDAQQVVNVEALNRQNQVEATVVQQERSLDNSRLATP